MEPMERKWVLFGGSAHGDAEMTQTTLKNANEVQPRRRRPGKQ